MDKRHTTFIAKTGIIVGIILIIFGILLIVSEYLYPYVSWSPMPILLLAPGFGFLMAGVYGILTEKRRVNGFEGKTEP